jgi:ADP-heptose:LPS heptosyltransferase
MGDQQEKELSQQVTLQCPYPIFDAVGQTSLLQMAALLQLCRLAIVNDGGPLHIAVAAGVKTASIFGPVDPVVYGPYPSEGHIVIKKGLACQPCYRQFRKADCSHLSCLRDLSVEEVFFKLERSL